MRTSNSRARSGLLMICALLATLSFDQVYWLLPVIIAGAALAGTYEVHRMGLAKGADSSLLLAGIGSLAFIIEGSCSPDLFRWTFPSTVLLLLAAAFVMHMVRKGAHDAHRAVPLTFFTPMYVGLPLGLSMQIVGTHRLYFLFVLCAVWATDTAAYYTGRSLGRHLMTPVLSPKKTWEGTWGGVIACVLVCLLFKAVAPAAGFDLTWLECLLMGIVLAVMAVIGDLAESALKRDVGVKDSGGTMAGHGGILDRIDSLLFCMPAFYAFLVSTGRI